MDPPLHSVTHLLELLYALNLEIYHLFNIIHLLTEGYTKQIQIWSASLVASDHKSNQRALSSTAVVIYAVHFKIWILKKGSNGHTYNLRPSQYDEWHGVMIACVRCRGETVWVKAVFEEAPTCNHIFITMLVRNGYIQLNKLCMSHPYTSF